MSRRSVAFARKRAQVQDRPEAVAKLIPRQTVKGAGTYLMHSPLAVNRRGGIVGEGHVCTLPMGPDKAARLTRGVKA